MDKKQFAGGFNTLLGETKERIEKAKQTPEKKPKYYMHPRATFLLDEDKIETLKAIAHWERKRIMDVIEEAVNDAINKRSPEDVEKAVKSYKEFKLKPNKKNK